MTRDPVPPTTWHGQTRGGWLRRHAALAPPATAPRPRGAIATDGRAGTRVDTRSVSHRARSARAGRGARSGRFWPSALIALALAGSVLVLLATRIRAQPG